MLNLFFTLLIMFIGSFIIQFIIMSLIMTNSIYDITISYGKLYISLIMAFSMCIIELYMFNLSTPSYLSKLLYIPFFIIILVLIYLYRNQSYIKDKEYLKEMIEHHSMAILTSRNISKITDNNDIKQFSNNIINNQQKEIELMKDLLKK